MIGPLIHGGLMTTISYIPFLKGIIYLLAGYLFARFVSSALAKIIQYRTRPRNILLTKRVTFYIVFALFIISALRQWGFELNVLLGATGIITVAFGLASQTVMANLVSGLFLLGENAYNLGDLIEINNIKGEIISIDAFSLRIKQNDGAIVRIPNDLLLKTPVTNLSRKKD